MESEPETIELMLFICAEALSTCESQKGQVYTLNLINSVIKRLMKVSETLKCDNLIPHFTLILWLIYVLNWYVSWL